MIRPWYRSRLIWLGMPGLLFLLWGWVDRSPSSLLTAKGSKLRLTTGNRTGTLTVAWETRPGGSGDFAISGRTGTGTPGSIPLFPPAIQHWKVDLSGFPGGGSATTVKVAYWFLIIVYLPLWLGVLAGWQRRKGRLLKSPATPPP
jgi:hypothetical protein